VIALQPLERMLSVVRERCTQIFKYTDDLADSDDSEDSDESEVEDMEKVSEFMLLERVVTKLAGIANVSATRNEPEVKENMNEEEIMMLNWMQSPNLIHNRKENGSVSFTPGSAPGKGKDRINGLNASESSDLEHPRKANALTSLSMEIIESLDTTDFNPLDLKKEVRIAVAAYLLTGTNGPWASWARNNVTEPHLWAFLHQVESQYLGNAFHNFSHAIDVEYTVARYMDLISAYQFIPETTSFCLLLGAIAHDLGHLGVTNQYLVETANELAVRYNDRSPLENMHCSTLFQIVSNPDTNVFAQVDKDSYKEMRKNIIEVILHTDVTKHNDMIKDIGMLYQMNSDAFDTCQPQEAITSPSTVLLMCNMLLHGADVSNPIKPWELCRRWACLCMEEFFAQGDLEKAASIPVQMLNDRDKVNRPNAQIGFIEFFIVPLASGMVQLFPQLGGLAEQLGENIQNWSEVWQEEVKPAPDAAAKVAARVKKVADNMNSLVVAAEEHRVQFGPK